MSLGDWNHYSDGGTLVSDPKGIVYTDLLTPITGTGSVALTHIPSTEFQSINLVPANLPTGFRSGRIRTLIRLDNFDDSGTPNVLENHVGVLCMQNQENIAQFGAFGGTGQAYGLSVTIGEGFSAQVVNLWKFSNGLDGSIGNLPLSNILMNIACPFPLTPSLIVALELEWWTDDIILTEVGGALLYGRIGQALDFSDLQTVIIYIDSISPYIVTVGEGIWAGFRNILNDTANKATFETTSVTRIAVS